MKQRLSELGRLFNERSLRERVLLLAVTLAAVLGLSDLLWLTPAYKQWQASRTQLRSAESARQTLHGDVKLLAHRREADGLAQNRELNTWRARVRAGELALREHEATLVGPDRMVALLDELLASHGQVRVRGMRSLGREDLLRPGGETQVAAPPMPGAPPAARVSEAPNAGAQRTAQAGTVGGPNGNATPDGVAPVGSTPPPGSAQSAMSNAAAVAAGSLYRHGVELTLEGSYPDLLAYLQALEALPQHLLWGGLTLSTDQYPKTVITLRLYTISRDRHWLEI